MICVTKYPLLGSDSLTHAFIEFFNTLAPCLAITYGWFIMVRVMHCGKSNQKLRGSVSEVKKRVLLVPEIAVRLRNRSCKCNRVHYNKIRV